MKDAESWATLSIMQTWEDIYKDYYIERDGTVTIPGNYPRPTNQLINFGLFFQDYFPTNPDYKVHVSVYYASPLVLSSPVYSEPSRYYSTQSAYRRVDFGLSKSLISRKAKPVSGLYAFLDEAWIYVEVFNLFGFENVGSYQWIRSVNNQEGLSDMYAVKNLLTGRLFNIRLSARF